MNQEESDLEIESYETAITNLQKDTDKSILIDEINEENSIEQEQIEKILKQDSSSNNIDEIINKTIEIETIHHIEIVEISKIDRHHSQRLDLAELHKIENHTIEMNESLKELSNNNNTNIEKSEVKVENEKINAEKDVNIDEKNREINTSKPSETTSNSSSTTTPSSSSSIGEPTEFIKCINKLIHSTQTVDKHLDNVQRANKEFVEFEKQNLKLSAIKQTLESLTLAIKTSILHKQAILEKSDAEKAKQIGKLFVELTTLHQNVVHKYKEKNALYLKNFDQWSQYDKDYQNIIQWLDQTTTKLNEAKASNLESSKLQEIIKVLFIL